MPIPEFDTDGFLPEGIHEVTIEELRQQFGRWQKSDQRPRLFKTLEALIAEVRSTKMVVEVIVNGSFATAEAEPSAIDLVLVLPKDHDFAAELRPFEYNVLSKRRVRKKYRFDVLIARQDSVEYDEYVQFFQQVKGRPNLHKGVLKVLL